MSTRILILGATGMLGHKLWQLYQNRFDTWATIRSSVQRYRTYDLFDPERLVAGVDAFDFDSVTKAVAIVRPDIVINCIGIIKQLPVAQDPIVSLTINSLFPHRLANLCRAADAHLIHISTDCVFSGRKGMYTEEDQSDAEDLYGRTKFLGEVAGEGSLTLRTSIIGRELQSSLGLVDWFLSNRGGQVQGYRRAIYSGLTTHALAEVIAQLIELPTPLSGLYQVSAEPISKYDLLCLLNRAFDAKIAIQPNTDIVIDRSLDSSRFRAVTGFTPPSWDRMVEELAADPTPYERWRN